MTLISSVIKLIVNLKPFLLCYYLMKVDEYRITLI